MKPYGLLILFLVFSSLAYPLIPVKAESNNLSFSRIDATVDLDTGDVTLFNWNNEAYLKLGSPVSLSSATKTSSKDKVVFSTPSFNLNIYTIDMDEGGIEFEVILKVKPLVNSFSFPIESKDLIFYYQPPLIQDG
jgi:hypothetical protein